MESTPVLPPNTTPSFWAIMIATFAFWLIAYALMMRRGFADKSFGMPVTALCCNMAWELLLSTAFASPYLAIHLGNILWLAFDLVLLVTILRFGREDFSDKDLVSKHLGALLALGLGMATLLQYLFMEEFGDHKGFFTGWACALLMSVLFIRMLIRRSSMKGQSFLIALSMLLGNAAAFLWVVNDPLSDTVQRTVMALLICTLFFNLAYVAMTYRVSRSLGVNPWTYV